MKTMKKQLSFLTMLLLTSLAFAQTPTDYVARYDFTNNLANSVSGGTHLIPTNTNYGFIHDRHSNPSAALDFSGASMTGYTYIASTSNPRNEVAMSFWVKLNLGTVSNRRPIAHIYSSSNNAGIYIDRLSGTQFEFAFKPTTGNAKYVVEDLSSIYDNQWHNIIFSVKKVGTTFDVSVYIDGNLNNNASTNLDFTNVATNTAIWNTNAMLKLAPAGSSQYSSAIDDILLFNRNLTDNEATAIAANTSCNIGNDNIAGFNTLSPFTANYLFGTKYTLSQVATLNSINLIGRTGVNTGVQMAVYDDNAGTPNNLIATATGAVNLGVVSLPVTPVVLQPGDYWIMAVYQNTGPHTYIKTTGGNPIYYQSFSYGSAIPTNASSFQSYTGQEFTTFLGLGCGNTLSTTSFNIDKELIAYPNPVSNVLNLKYNSNITAVRVYNLLGQEVINQNINTTTTQIDMSKLNTGTYMVSVTVEDTVKTIKVIKK